nr:hypothetical protein CFP56_09244 [Quercus suber]
MTVKASLIALITTKGVTLGTRNKAGGRKEEVRELRKVQNSSLSLCVWWLVIVTCCAPRVGRGDGAFNSDEARSRLGNTAEASEHQTSQSGPPS